MSAKNVCGNGSRYQYIMFTINNIEHFRTHLIVEIVVNVFLAILTTLGNGVIICAIMKSPNLRTPSYLLITSLAFADLLVGLLSNTISAALYGFYLKRDLDVQRVCALDVTLDAVTMALASFALTMSMFIAIDRFLALHLRHKYKTTITKRLTIRLIISTWLIFLPLTIVMQQVNNWEAILSSIGLLQLVILSTFYIMAFVELRRFTSQVTIIGPLNSWSARSFDAAKYKETLKKMLIILGTFLLCFAPSIFIYAVVFQIFGTTVVTTSLSRSSWTVVTLNSTINPVIYLVYFKDIRLAIKLMLGHFKCLTNE